MFVQSNPDKGYRRFLSALPLVLYVFVLLTVLVGPLTIANAQNVLFPQTLRIWGGIDGGDKLFTWQSNMHINGDHWRANSTLIFHFLGPMNNPTVAPVDRTMTLLTDAGGNIQETFFEGQGAVFSIPYDHGITGNLGTGLPDIPCPGLYQVFAVLDDPFRIQFASAPGPIHLLPLTAPAFFGPARERDFIYWAHSRGAREGFLGFYSPEHLDPEWVSVWSRRPIEMYGTVAATDSNGN